MPEASEISPAGTDVPFRAINTIEPLAECRERPDGSWIVRDPRPLRAAETSIVNYLRHWAAAVPDRAMLGERDRTGAWRTLSYGEMLVQANAAGQWLLDRGIAPGQTVLILSPASIEHAVLAMGAMTVGVTIAPISPPYSLQRSGWSKLRKVVEAVRPAAVFTQQAAPYADAIAAASLDGVPWIVADGDCSGPRTTDFAEILNTRPTGAVEAAFARTGPDTVAKILFSSGSTGWPKGILNTQRMMCFNQACHDTIWLPEEHCGPFCTVNWMPWHHTMAGNGLFNRSLRQGGTYYIENARPIPGQFDSIIASLGEISPHSYSDVPAGFAMLATALEEDPALRDNFFENLVFLQYAGASLPMELWQRWQELSARATGFRTPFLTGYGCTETGPSITQLYWPVEGSGYIGVPVPGVEMKLIPVDDTRFEVRARGGNLTPGYLGDDALYAEAIDAEGFYATGDAATFVDPADPAQGFRFASRVAEDFKLLTGTFVAVGSLRATAVGALMPLVTDMVIAGHDRAFVGALIWPDLAACRKLVSGDAATLSDEQVIAHPDVRDALRAKLQDYNAAHSGSSQRIARALLMARPPSPEENEITDKGYVNQRRVLECRAPLLDLLYAEPPAREVLVPA